MAAAMDQRDGVTAVTATRYPLGSREEREEEGPAGAARGGGRWACAVTPSRPSFAALRSSAPVVPARCASGSCRRGLAPSDSC